MTDYNAIARAQTVARFERQSQAEQFVDDTTLLRMLRVRMPQADPDVYGLGSQGVHDRHMHLAVKEEWGTALCDIALRFQDGSLAYRLRDQQRWEVYRSW